MIDAIAVMWKRQIKTYLRSKHRLIGSLAQPLLFLVAFGFGFGPIFEQAGRGNYIQFLIPGIIGMTILFSSVMNGMSLIWDKQFGFLKETLVAPVPRINLLIGRCLGGATTSTFQGIVVLAISFLMGYKVVNWALFPVGILFMFLISFLFTLLGTSIASKVEDMLAFPTMMNFMIMPMFFLSGALFPIDNFPSFIHAIAIINPMTYCVDLLHYTLGTSASFSFMLDMGVVVGLMVLLFMIGTYCFNRIET